MGALEWVSQIAEWIGQWVPRWIILDTTMGAVKYVGGAKAVKLGPGVHFYWPVRTTLETYPTARQAEDLRSQTLVTTDGHTVVVGGMVVYRVADIMQLVPHTYSPARAIKDLTLTAIHDVCCRLSLEDLKKEQQRGTLDTKLRNEARKTLSEFGVEVIKVQLTDLAPTRVYKILQATSKEED